MKNEYTEMPISDSILGVDESSIIRGVTELYIPETYKKLKCEITKINYHFENVKKVKLTLDFTIYGDKQQDYYKGEEWKRSTIEYFFQSISPVERKISIPYPIMGIMLNKYSSIEKVKDLFTGEDIPFDQSIDNIFSYESPKPKQILDENEFYKYYNKKATFIYDDLNLNKKYSYEITFISEAMSFEFAIISPYQTTNFSNFSSTTNSEIKIKTFIEKIEPTISKNLPYNVLKKLEKHLPENWHKHIPPTYITAANPFRGEEKLFPLSSKIDNVSTIKENKPQTLRDFESLRFITSMTIPEDKDLEIIINIQEKPIPTRIYEQIQYIKNYNDLLINFDIFNFSNKKRKLRIEAEIEGYTSSDKRTMLIHGLNDKDEKIRVKGSLCPRMKRGILNTIKNPEKATLIVRIIDEVDNKLIEDRTYPVTLLPEDEMVFSMKSMSDSKMYNLSKFIGSWIYPKDSEGEFDRIRSGAVKYTKNNSFCYDGTDESLLEHVKAVYNYLSLDLGFKYINQPFNSYQKHDSQRVVLPDQSLKNKAGNCIDLTILFASLLEGFGINSLIFITRNHAFIGWGDKTHVDKIIALETTFLGRYSFEDAIKTGKEKIIENYLFTGSNGGIFPGMINYITKGVSIISLKECRNSGILNKS